jgi:DNA-binding MarR family transcriptional regulator
MSIRNAINVAIRVRRLEQSRKMKVAQQLEALTDPTFIERISQPEDRVMVLTPKGKALARRSVYSRKRDIVQ